MSSAVRTILTRSGFCAHKLRVSEETERNSCAVKPSEQRGSSRRGVFQIDRGRDRRLLFTPQPAPSSSAPPSRATSACVCSRSRIIIGTAVPHQSHRVRRIKLLTQISTRTVTLDLTFHYISCFCFSTDD